MKIARLMGSFARDPVTVGRALPGEYRQRHGSEQYGADDVDEAWDEHLHEPARACPGPARSASGWTRS